MADVAATDAHAHLEQIVRELAADFDGMPVDTIEQLVAGSFGELSQNARIDTYLAVLTKRVARERLRAQASSAA